MAEKQHKVFYRNHILIVQLFQVQKTKTLKIQRILRLNQKNLLVTKEKLKKELKNLQNIKESMDVSQKNDSSSVLKEQAIHSYNKCNSQLNKIKIKLLHLDNEQLTRITKEFDNKNYSKQFNIDPTTVIFCLVARWNEENSLCLKIEYLITFEFKQNKPENHSQLENILFAKLNIIRQKDEELNKKYKMAQQNFKTQKYQNQVDKQQILEIHSQLEEERQKNCLFIIQKPDSGLDKRKELFFYFSFNSFKKNLNINLIEFSQIKQLQFQNKLQKK